MNGLGNIFPEVCLKVWEVVVELVLVGGSVQSEKWRIHARVCVRMSNMVF